VNSSYTLDRDVPVHADATEIEQVRSAAVAQWFTQVWERGLTPAEAPDTELVQGDVVKVNGRVVITQSWRVWGHVQPRSLTGV